MRVLFDQGTAPLRQLLLEHEVETAYERGWSSLQNGDLIAAAEAAGFTDHQLAAHQSGSCTCRGSRQ